MKLDSNYGTPFDFFPTPKMLGFLFHPSLNLTASGLASLNKGAPARPSRRLKKIATYSIRRYD